MSKTCFFLGDKTMHDERCTKDGSDCPDAGCIEGCW